jgi:hypothetical protein
MQFLQGRLAGLLGFIGILIFTAGLASNRLDYTAGGIVMLLAAIGLLGWRRRFPWIVVGVLILAALIFVYLPMLTGPSR